MAWGSKKLLMGSCLLQVWVPCQPWKLGAAGLLLACVRAVTGFTVH